MAEDATDSDVIEPIDGAVVDADATTDRDVIEPIDSDVVDQPETLSSETDDQTADTDEGEGDADEDDSDDETPEFIEFTFGGKKLVIPKGAVPAELEAEIQSFSEGTWSDFTKGKQEIAEAAKGIAQDREALAQFQTMNTDMLQNYSQGLQIRSEIEELSKVDVKQLWQTNPDQARQLSDRLSGLQSQFQTIVGQVDQYEQQISTAQSEDFTKRTAEGTKTLDARIKGFSTDIVPELTKYVMSKGMSEQEAGQWALNPKVTEMAYKAMMYDKMKAAPKKVAKVKPAQAVPAAKSRGKATRTISDPDKMGMDDYVKWRGKK